MRNATEVSRFKTVVTLTMSHHRTEVEDQPIRRQASESMPGGGEQPVLVGDETHQEETRHEDERGPVLCRGGPGVIGAEQRRAQVLRHIRRPPTPTRGDRWNQEVFSGRGRSLVGSMPGFGPPQTSVSPIPGRFPTPTPVFRCRRVTPDDATAGGGRPAAYACWAAISVS